MGLVEIVHAPDEPPLRIAPGAKILEVEIADRENFRSAGQFRAVLRPKLRPAIIGGAKEEERIGPHLLVLVIEVALDNGDAPLSSRTPRTAAWPRRCP